MIFCGGRRIDGNVERKMCLWKKRNSRICNDDDNNNNPSKRQQLRRVKHYHNSYTVHWKRKNIFGNRQMLVTERLKYTPWMELNVPARVTLMISTRSHSIVTFRVVRNVRNDGAETI